MTLPRDITASFLELYGGVYGQPEDLGDGFPSVSELFAL